MKWILHLSGYSDSKAEKYLQLQEFSTLNFAKKPSSYGSCTHTHKSTEKFHFKKIFNFLKEFMFGRDIICFIKQNKNSVFLLNFSLTALYHLSQSLAVTGLRASLFPLPRLSGCGLCSHPREHKIMSQDMKTEGKQEGHTLLFLWLSSLLLPVYTN